MRPEIGKMTERQDRLWRSIAYNPQAAAEKTRFGVEMAIFIDYAMYRKCVIFYQAQNFLPFFFFFFFGLLFWMNPFVPESQFQVF